jgi:hypothetical protein
MRFPFFRFPDSNSVCVCILLATSLARLTPLNVASYNYKSILYILFRFLSNETSVANSNSSKQLHVSHLTHIKMLAATCDTSMLLSECGILC